MKSLFLILLTINTIIITAEIPNSITTAINKLDYGFIDYQFSMVDDQVMNQKHLRRVSDFNPKNQYVFNLNDKNGNIPSKRDIRSYSRDKINLFGKDRFLRESTFTFKNLAIAKDYNFIVNDNGISKYSLINTNSVIPDSKEPLYGELWIDDEKKEVKKIILKNIDPMDIFLGITISNIELEFDFEPAVKKHTLIESIVSIINGNILFFKIDYVGNIVMDNYIKVDYN